AGRPCLGARRCCFRAGPARPWPAGHPQWAGPVPPVGARRAGRAARRGAHRSRPPGKAGCAAARRRPARPPSGPRRRRSLLPGTSAAGGGAAPRFFEHLADRF
nr:hypothetical protein [Tanacetum cinerariifolium]